MFSIDEKFTVFKGEDGVGPTSFLLLKSRNVLNLPISPNCNRVINLIESQPVYTGLFNYDSIEMSLFDKLFQAITIWRILLSQREPLLLLKFN